MSDSISISPEALVCKDADLKGNVTIGPGCVLHPCSKVHALGGPIVLGANNIVEELVVIRNSEETTLNIGDDNVFEVGSIVESKQIGSRNRVEAKACLLPGSELGDNNVVGVKAVLQSDKSVGCDVMVREMDGGSVYSKVEDEKSIEEARVVHAELHKLHLDILRKSLPTCHDTKS